jgi:hypothetical protein
MWWFKVNGFYWMNNFYPNTYQLFSILLSCCFCHGIATYAVYVDDWPQMPLTQPNHLDVGFPIKSANLDRIKTID